MVNVEPCVFCGRAAKKTALFVARQNSPGAQTDLVVVGNGVTPPMSGCEGLGRLSVELCRATNL